MRASTKIAITGMMLTLLFSASSWAQTEVDATLKVATGKQVVFDEVPPFDLGDAVGEDELRTLLELLEKGDSITPPRCRSVRSSGSSATRSGSSPAASQARSLASFSLTTST